LREFEEEAEEGSAESARTLATSSAKRFEVGLKTRSAAENLELEEPEPGEGAAVEVDVPVQWDV